VDQRNISGSFNNSTLNGNNNIQADNNTQIQNDNSKSLENAFKELFDEIKKISDESTRDQAEYFANDLKEAYETNNKDKAKKVLSFLKGTIGTVASLASIARFFGLGF